MPLEVLTGTDVPALMAKAQQRLGDDAVVLSMRRRAEGGRTLYELVAADPVTAARQRHEERLAPRGAEAVLEGERASVRTSRPAPTAPAPAGHAPEDASAWSRDPAPSPRASASRTRDEDRPRRRTARGPAPATPRRPRVIALVGPTGAGKTTTIAKLASHPRGFGGRRVGLVCLDTFRIAGVEQAKQVAELARIPLEVVWELRHVGRALRRLRGRDVVLVDTPGRGPRAASDLRELQARLLELSPDEVHLVLPAGLQPALARRLVVAHLPLGVTHLLPSKLDEYPDERGAFELARQFALPMRWIADGQQVPRDLQPAPESPAPSAPSARPRVALEAV